MTQNRRDFIKNIALTSTGIALLNNNWVSEKMFTARAHANHRFDLRYRQVHLDFHTSQHIAGIGDAFDAEEFASVLDQARVNSVTAFARCHHGYNYYDGKAHPERKHPHLKRNLLREQIEACHKRNIRVPIYTTVGWDQYTADEHPEWRQVLPDGKMQGTPPYEAGFYRLMCLNSPYKDFLKAHVKDIFDSVPVDGLFFDIIKTQDCSCPYCRQSMEKLGIDAANEKARLEFGKQVHDKWVMEMTAHVKALGGMNKNSSVFYNGGHVGYTLRPIREGFSHWELESLPSGGWGYLHFPMSVRYARTLDADCLGMTGKFHTSWGDFHSLKNPAALQFECFQMLALGAKCSIGDQLHPAGKIDAATYDLIGSVYREVEKKEAWCKDAKPLVDIGMIGLEEFIGGRVPPPGGGLTRMLHESQHQFDILDTQSDFSKYKVLVLPDEIAVNAALAAKIQAYLAGGGSLIASYHSGLNEAKDAFALLALGVKFKGDAPYSPDFIKPRAALSKAMPNSELAMYLKGLEVEPLAGSEVLADCVIPYFNRTWDHYSSHKHTPSSGKVGYAGVVRNGRSIYFAHPIFTQYNKNAPRWCKQLFLNALELLLPEPLVKLEQAPTTTITAYNEQSNRRVLHLLHYIPERRGMDFDVIEDVIPIFAVKVSAAVQGSVKDVSLAPQGTRIPFEQKGKRVNFTVPKVDGHQMIAIS